MSTATFTFQSDELRQRGIHFKSLTDSIDTSSPMGRFIFHIMSALAEMERELIVDRTRAGLVAAREKGRIGGWRTKLPQRQWGAGWQADRKRSGQKAGGDYLRRSGVHAV